MRSFLTAAALVAASGAWAQNMTVQWAQQVDNVSSEQGIHTAIRATGSPNRPAGDSPDAWQPKEGDKEFIQVGFAQPLAIRKVIVLENMNPGSITKVTAIDEAGANHELRNTKPAKLKDTSRTLLIEVPLTSYKVKGIRLELNTQAVPGAQQIDAIGITDRAGAVSLISLPPDLDVNSRPERLPEGVNSAYAELGPLISPDGSTLYFSRRNHPQNIGGKDDKEDIWVSRRTASGWGAASNIGRPLNNESYNFVSSVTPDGNMLLLGNVYLPDGEMEAGASFTVRNPDGSFSEPEPIKIRRDKNKSDQVDYFLSTSGRVLIVSEQRDKGYGGRDLFVSFQNDEGVWSEPENLGPAVNTAADEFAPFLAADNRSLYFSTSGRPGYGAEDIFLARRINDGWQEWTEPENLGRPINGPGKDAYFTLPANGSYAYYTSAGAGKGETDIYRIVLPKSQRPKPVVLVSGRVLDKKTNKPVAAEIVYEDLTTGKPAGLARSDAKTGEYQIALPGGQNFGYVGRANGYFGVSANLDLTKLNQFREIKKDLYLAPREVGAIVRLNNLFFDFNKADLKPESYPELARVLTYLKQNPKLELEINGHTDSVGTDVFNLELSKRRAQAVVDYLTSKGAEPARLTMKSFGEDQPIAPNNTEEGRAENRRVEFVVRKL